MTNIHNEKPLLYGLVAVLLGGSILLLAEVGKLVEPADIERTDTTQTVRQETVVPVRVEARWLLAGEVFWGRRMEQVAETKENPYSYLFSKLATFEPDKYDAWLAHLECPITTTDIPFSVQTTQLLFNCQPEYLPEFAKWFHAVSLANNHADNVSGLTGFNQTRENLEEVSVQYYGHYDNSRTADICEIIGLPARIIMSDDSQQQSTLPVAMCGYNNVFRLPTDRELDEITRYSEHFYTIVSPQQGAEYQPAADNIKRQTYRAMVERGADLVVASHPHWVQDTEVYQGKLIMYSVGNFMFDQEWSEETKRGVALDLILSSEYTELIQDVLDLGPDCIAFKDDCLSTQPLKPTFTGTYALVSSLHQDALTRKAPDAIHQLNLTRTNWDETRLKLNPHD